MSKNVVAIVTPRFYQNGSRMYKLARKNYVQTSVLKKNRDIFYPHRGTTDIDV